MQLAGSARAAPVIFMLLSSALPPTADAQCKRDVRALAGELGYRLRGARCEGLYVELQSAPAILRVVALVRGGRLDSQFRSDTIPLADSFLVLVPPDLRALVGLDSTITILSQPIGAGPNWVMDAEAVGSSRFRWNIDEVLRSTDLPPSRVGVVGTATRAGNQPRASGRRDTVYVPLRVVRENAVGSPSSTASDSIYFAFHLPSAGYARVCVEPADSAQVIRPPLLCTDARQVQVGSYFDGYFEAMLPPGKLGLNHLVVLWRTSAAGPVGRDRLEILRW